MLLAQNYVIATAAWLLVRLQVEAFSVVGLQNFSKVTDGKRGQQSSCVPTPQQSPSWTLDAIAWGRPSRGSERTLKSTGGDAVESPVGTASDQNSVLDALIDQFTSPKSGSVTAAVEEYLDLCDHALLTHLRGRIEAEEAQSPEVRALPHAYVA